MRNKDLLRQVLGNDVSEGQINEMDKKIVDLFRDNESLNLVKDELEKKRKEEIKKITGMDDVEKIYNSYKKDKEDFVKQECDIMFAYSLIGIFNMLWFIKKCICHEEYGVSEYIIVILMILVAIGILFGTKIELIIGKVVSFGKVFKEKLIKGNRIIAVLYTIELIIGKVVLFGKVFKEKLTKGNRIIAALYTIESILTVIFTKFGVDLEIIIIIDIIIVIIAIYSLITLK